MTLNYNITKSMSKFFNVVLCEMCTDIAQEPAAYVIRLGALIVMMDGAGCCETSGHIYWTTQSHIPEYS